MTLATLPLLLRSDSMDCDVQSLVGSITHPSASSILILQVLSWIESGREGSRLDLVKPDGLAGNRASQNHVSLTPRGGGLRASQNRILLCDRSPAADKSLNHWLRAAEQFRHFCLSLQLPFRL